MRWPGAFVALVLTVGIAGTAIALNGREGDAQFVARQQDLVPVGPAALERLIVTTSDPRPGYAGHARWAGCSSSDPGALGDPWSCLVRYPRLPRVRYDVTVHADRSIYGSGQPEGRPLGRPLTVSGCCVGAP
jgi:hypothetical protein